MAKITETWDKFNIKGLLLSSEPMWRHTTFLVGGPADLYAVPSDEEDLRRLLNAARNERLETFTLGGGSNLLIADSGIRGLVIDTRFFNGYKIEGEILTLGSGLPVSDAVWRAGSSGLAGLEFLFGMPGSVGGAVWMNARCYDAEIADQLVWVDAMDNDGKVHRLPVNRNEWDYKVSPFQNSDLTILQAAFRVSTGKSESLKAAMMEKRNDRESKGHYRSPCAGSAFKNNRAFGAPSGVLIDRCGLKGFRIGGASVSSWHGNIVINDKCAAAEDIRAVLEEVGRKVEKATGFKMEPEVLMVGDWVKG